MELFMLRPVADEDVDRIARWLDMPHVKRWFEDPEAWLEEIRGRKDAYSFLNHFIAMDGDTPFAFCQYYDCHAAQEEWYNVEAPGQVYSIDYMIGDPAYLGKGYGKAMVAALTCMVKARDPGAKEIIVQPDRENALSNGVLEANGYVFEEEKQYYRKVL